MLQPEPDAWCCTDWTDQCSQPGVVGKEGGFLLEEDVSSWCRVEVKVWRGREGVSRCLRPTRTEPQGPETARAAHSLLYSVGNAGNMKYCANILYTVHTLQCCWGFVRLCSSQYSNSVKVNALSSTVHKCSARVPIQCNHSALLLSFSASLGFDSWSCFQRHRGQ